MVHFDANLTGTVADVSLADLLQLFHYAKKSVTVHVSGHRGGSVVMIDGEIRHARCADEQGEDALALLLAQKLVRVRTSAAGARSPWTVHRNFSALVLDLLRQNDEHERDTGDLLTPVSATDTRLTCDLQNRLAQWLAGRPDIEHCALIEPRDHVVLACDEPHLWVRLVQSLLLQTLVAPYFDDSFDEIDGLLPALADADPDERQTDERQTDERQTDERQTVVTFDGRRYVLCFEPSYGWVVVLIFRAKLVSHGLSLTHMGALRRAIREWVSEHQAPHCKTSR